MKEEGKKRKKEKRKKRKKGKLFPQLWETRGGWAKAKEGPQCTSQWVGGVASVLCFCRPEQAEQGRQPVLSFCKIKI